MRAVIVFVVLLAGCENFLGRADYYTCPVTMCASGTCCDCDCDVGKEPANDTTLCSATSQDECLSACESYCP